MSKVTELYVLSFYNGRTTVRPYKGLHVSHEHSNLLTIVLIPLYVRVPKTIPLLELFSSKGGTFRFQGRNFLVPAEELFDSYVGNSEHPRGYFQIPP